MPPLCGTGGLLPASRSKLLLLSRPSCWLYGRSAGSAPLWGLACVMPGVSRTQRSKSHYIGICDNEGSASRRCAAGIPLQRRPDAIDHLNGGMAHRRQVSSLERRIVDRLNGHHVQCDLRGPNSLQLGPLVPAEPLVKSPPTTTPTSPMIAAVTGITVSFRTDGIER